MRLPQQLTLQQMQNTWATALDPLLNNPANNSIILKNVALVSGTNVINHLLQQRLVGWKTTRVRAAATIYDLQDTNPTPTLTLVLVASAPVVVDLEVFA